MNITLLIILASATLALALTVFLIIWGVAKKRRQLNSQYAKDQVQQHESGAAPPGEEFPLSAEGAQAARALEERLRGLGVKMSVKSACAGNAFTRYELLPDIDERADRILDFQSDIALALGVQNLFIQIPLPGENTLGIDAPLNEPSSLSLGGAIARLEKKQEGRIPGGFAIATGAGGELISSTLEKCAHIMIAGSLATGKSMTLHGIASTMITGATKEELRLIMIDIKGTELAAYKGLDLLLMPVINDARTASGALGLAEIEMNERYKKLAALELQSIEEYEKMAGGKPSQPMPRIVIFADDLNGMLREGSEPLPRERLFSLLERGAKVGVHVVLTVPLPCSASLLDSLAQRMPSKVCLLAPSAQAAMAVVGSDYAAKLAPQGSMLLRLREPGYLLHGRGLFVPQESIKKLRAQCRNNPPERNSS